MTWRSLPTPSEQRDPRPVAESLERIAASLGAPRPGLLSAVFARWDDLVGHDVAAHATPRSLRDGVLLVTVDHPAWASSLRMLSADLLRRIADQGAGEVRELVVQVDTAAGRSRAAGAAGTAHREDGAAPSRRGDGDPRPRRGQPRPRAGYGRGRRREDEDPPGRSSR